MDASDKLLAAIIVIVAAIMLISYIGVLTSAFIVIGCIAVYGLING